MRQTTTTASEPSLLLSSLEGNRGGHGGIELREIVEEGRVGVPGVAAGMGNGTAANAVTSEGLTMQEVCDTASVAVGRVVDNAELRATFTNEAGCLEETGELFVMGLAAASRGLEESAAVRLLVAVDPFFSSR